jgi:hypothetical protein
VQLEAAASEIKRWQAAEVTWFNLDYKIFRVARKIFFKKKKKKKKKETWHLEVRCISRGSNNRKRQQKHYWWWKGISSSTAQEAHSSRA